MISYIYIHIYGNVLVQLMQGKSYQIRNQKFNFNFDEYIFLLFIQISGKNVQLYIADLYKN